MKPKVESGPRVLANEKPEFREAIARQRSNVDENCQQEDRWRQLTKVGFNLSLVEFLP